MFAMVELALGAAKGAAIGWGMKRRTAILLSCYEMV